MSIHSSLRAGDTLKGERSVLTRIERIAVLKKAGKFDENKRSIYGLPKVRTKFKVAGAKKKKEEKPAAGAPGAPGAPAAAGAPAAGAAGAKGAAPAAATGAAPAAAPKKGDKK